MFDFLDGYKTLLGGILAVLTGSAMALTGAAGLIAGFVDPTGPYAMDPLKAWTAITTGLATAAGGLSVMGIGHKLEKNTQAVKAVGAEKPQA